MANSVQCADYESCFLGAQAQIMHDLSPFLFILHVTGIILMHIPSVFTAPSMLFSMSMYFSFHGHFIVRAV